MADFLHTLFDGRSFIGLLVILMAFDVITGILRAVKFKVLASNINRDGMIWKAAVLLAVLFGWVLQQYAPGFPANIAETTALGFCLTEAISLIENFGQLGVKLPSGLTDVLLKLNGKDYDKTQKDEANDGTK